MWVMEHYMYIYIHIYIFIYIGITEWQFMEFDLILSDSKIRLAHYLSFPPHRLQSLFGFSGLVYLKLFSIFLLGLCVWMYVQTQGLLPAQHHARLSSLGESAEPCFVAKASSPCSPVRAAVLGLCGAIEQSCLGKRQDRQSGSSSALLFLSHRFLSFLSLSLRHFPHSAPNHWQYVFLCCLYIIARTY